MELHDWLLFFHVLSAFLVAGALTALWWLVYATRPAGPLLADDDAQRFGNTFGPVVGAGMAGAIVFGVWLALEDDAYGIFDGWIIAAVVLWAVAGWSGDRSGRLFGKGERSQAITFQLVNTVLVLVILVLMIWKPGA